MEIFGYIIHLITLIHQPLLFVKPVSIDWALYLRLWFGWTREMEIRFTSPYDILCILRDPLVPCSKSTCRPAIWGSSSNSLLTLLLPILEKLTPSNSVSGWSHLFSCVQYTCERIFCYFQGQKMQVSRQIKFKELSGMFKIQGVKLWEMKNSSKIYLLTSYPVSEARHWWYFVEFYAPLKITVCLICIASHLHWY